MRCSMLTAPHAAGTSWDLNPLVRKTWSSQLLSAVPRLQPAAAPSWWPADYFYQRGWECLGCDEMCVFRVHLAWKAPFFPLGGEGGRTPATCFKNQLALNFLSLSIPKTVTYK